MRTIIVILIALALFATLLFLPHPQVEVVPINESEKPICTEDFGKNNTEVE